ncbi:MAG TPA: hypothetical protein DDY18_09070 [Flavobacterium sp.]|nr:hypothetical protein [Flavobacterium sp.]
MKILYVSSHPHLDVNADTGYGTHIRKTIEGFRTFGHDVKVVSACNIQVNEQILSSTPSKGGKSILKKLIPVFIWETLKDFRWVRQGHEFQIRVEKEIQDFQPDMVYERGVYLICPIVKKKTDQFIYVLEVNAPLLEEKRKMGGRSLFDFIQRKRTKFQFDSCDFLITVSSVLRSFFIQNYGLAEKKVVFLPNAVDPEEIQIDKEFVDQICCRFSFEDKEVVGFVGSMFPYHGVELLIHAFAKLCRENSRLLLVGDGYVVENLKQLSRELEIADKVYFVGKVAHDKVYSYISLMDVCVMPASNWYGSPVKIFEYAAMGKFIIAPNNGPVNDVMVHLVDGFLVNGQNEIHDALVYYFNDKKSCDTVAMTFKEKVLQEFIWSKNVEKILNLTSNN